MKSTFIAVRELLSKTERWTQHTMATNTHGWRVEPTDPQAVCWCLVGAINKVKNKPHAGYSEPESLFLGKLLNSFPDSWQDKSERTHDEVLSLLEEAIASC